MSESQPLIRVAEVEFVRGMHDGKRMVQLAIRDPIIVAGGRSLSIADGSEAVINLAPDVARKIAGDLLSFATSVEGIAHDPR